MRIIGPPSATLQTVLANLTDYQPVFKDSMVPALWKAGVKYTVDPVGLIAQAHKETGGGSFKGKVKPEFCNPAGIKVRYQNLFPELAGDNPLAHAMFPSWDVGTEAHAQHIRAYTNWPVEGLVVDPRYTYVIGKYKCESWSDLSGKWAPSLTYGQEVEVIMQRLIGG